MNDDWQIAGCNGKEAFSDPQSARAVILRIKRNAKSSRLKRQRDFANREAYRCRHCGQWHIGHGGKDVR
jgi:hypothetical protein